MRRGAELTANELDGTGIRLGCMQISQGNAINLSHRIGSSMSLRVETERQPDMDRVASALSLG